MIKEYEGIPDEELIRRAQNGEKKLEEFLIDKYKGMVRKKAHAMFLIGGEQEDLIQEGMIGLFRAVRDYRPSKNASFATFASLCVERQIYKAIEISGRQKHRPLNSYISLSEENSPLKNTEDTKQQNPEEIIIDRESTNLMQEKIKERLSPFENQVLRAYLEGKDYHQIARQMEKSPKSIDNALQRIRNKIHDLMETL
ncbi:MULTISPECIES: RNA polymerase sporulation sigma factor SigH [unclassified Blautia]|uniref:RNA polymerase sporulation sigma factor SigH n=1 Tax=unclassified Blautia TaxID=2648079 RepID=UPI000B393F05|nr:MULTISPECIES: RNA polymerase sporulation sigma factor SigH [unclassified Blautia]OUN32011.1 RNA polymerase sporulation sigma factor SigH [Blautia sp. An81]OUN94958.1 RNA polymerase sporulation sigma factor SigH [Blautia sp. An46]